MVYISSDGTLGGKKTIWSHITSFFQGTFLRNMHKKRTNIAHTKKKGNEEINQKKQMTTTSEDSFGCYSWRGKKMNYVIDSS